MTTINTGLLIIHILSVVAILLLLVLQWNKNPRKLNPGIVHAGLTALVAGLALMGMFSTLNPDETINYSKYAIKLLILVTILIISYRNVKKTSLAKRTWLVLIGLTLTNILIALLWIWSVHAPQINLYFSCSRNRFKCCPSKGRALCRINSFSI